MATAALIKSGTMKGVGGGGTDADDGLEMARIDSQSRIDYVVSDAPCTFENDPSRSAFGLAITIDKAIVSAGSKLNPQEVISLMFLLLDDPAQALKLCIEVETGKFPAPAGKTFMASLIYNGIKKKLPRWDVKIVCALHLLRKYQVSLQPSSSRPFSFHPPSLNRPPLIS
jgi:hypothetical protein